jgi:hypothetical protein
VEIGVDKNTTVVFPAPLMSTIGELGAFLARETAAGAALPPVSIQLPADSDPVQPNTDPSATLHGAPNGRADVQL